MQLPAKSEQLFQEPMLLFVNQQWDTLGRAIFNLDPQAAIRHFDHDMEVVE